VTPETKPINIKQLKMKAEYVLLDSIRDELRKIRQLMDTTCRFDESSIAAKPVPKLEKREVAESETKLEAAILDVVNWNPAELEWETIQPTSGKKPYERYPFTGQNPESKPDYHNLREAISAVQKTGKHTLGHKESGYYYWLSDDKAVIMRRKSQW